MNRLIGFSTVMLFVEQKNKESLMNSLTVLLPLLRIISNGWTKLIVVIEIEEVKGQTE